MRAMKGGMVLILFGLLIFSMSLMGLVMPSVVTSASATTEPFPKLSVKDYECKPDAGKSVNELQRIEKLLTGSEQLLSKYKQFGIDQHRTPAILFLAAAEDIAKAYREHGRDWKEYFWVTFPSRISWDLLERYVNGYWSTWIDKDQAESFVFKRSLVPNRSNSETWFHTHVWRPAQLRMEELFSRYEQKTVDPLKLRWAALISELEASGLCKKKTALASEADCSQMLAQVKKAMRQDLSDASQLYSRLEKSDKPDASEIPRKLLQKMKEWQSRAAQARSDCPDVANYIDNSLNRWLCTVGPSGAENLEMMCSRARPTL